MAKIAGFPRQLEPEVLDHLAEDDPRAQRSRRDLQRINLIMGSAGLLASSMRQYAAMPPRRILELGAGDGSLMLRLARRFARSWPGVELTLLDRQDLVADSTRAAFADLGWTVRTLQADVTTWCREADDNHWDIALANLFIHHFDPAQIGALFTALAQRSSLVLALEPRRDRLALTASRLVGLIGANDVTREDAVLSVRAGFTDDELSRLWPHQQGWRLEESRAGLFSHRFIAARQS